MIITWIFDIFAILLSVVAYYLNKKEAKVSDQEDIFFGRMCLLSAASAAVKMVEDTRSPGLIIGDIDWQSIVLSYFYSLFEIGVIYVWLFFADFMICRSKDHLRVIKPPIVWGFGALILIETVITAITLYRMVLPDSAFDIDVDLMVKMWVSVSYYLLILIETLIILISTVILARYRMRRKGPVLFRGIPFCIPVIVGGAITVMLQYRFDFNPFAAGVGNFLLYLSMNKERQFIDSETGFFSMEYLMLLSNIDKKNYEGGLGILINTEGDAQTAIEIIKDTCPEEIDVIRVSEGSFFLVGERRSKSVMEIFRQYLMETATGKGIDLSVRYGIRGDEESAEALLNKLMAKL